MTSEQHEAGRALDELICRRVMGYEIRQYEDGSRPWEVRDGKLFGLPFYSTDIAAAMLVFEAGVEMFGAGSISADMEDARGQGFIVLVGFGFNGAGAMGPLPLAICRAALDAIGESDG